MPKRKVQAKITKETETIKVGNREYRIYLWILD